MAYGVNDAIMGEIDTKSLTSGATLKQTYQKFNVQNNGSYATSNYNSENKVCSVYICIFATYDLLANVSTLFPTITVPQRNDYIQMQGITVNKV